MQSFEECLSAISSRLIIRYEVIQQVNGESHHTFCMQNASKEVQQAFKNALQNHIYAKLDTCEVGKSVVYSYHFGRSISKSPSIKGSFTSSFNANMEEVLAEIPKLPADQFYMFPGSATLRVKLVSNEPNDPKIKIYFDCDWLV